MKTFDRITSGLLLASCWTAQAMTLFVVFWIGVDTHLGMYYRIGQEALLVIFLAVLTRVAYLAYRWKPFGEFFG